MGQEVDAQNLVFHALGLYPEGLGEGDLESLKPGGSQLDCLRKLTWLQCRGRTREGSRGSEESIYWGEKLVTWTEEVVMEDLRR